MSLTVVVTRNVPERFRGFLSSVMLEVSPGTYVNPAMSQGVRTRMWQVCGDWASLLPSDACVTVLWRDATSPGGLRIEVLGAPKTALVDHEGLWLDRRELTEAHLKSLGDSPQMDSP